LWLVAGGTWAPAQTVPASQPAGAPTTAAAVTQDVTVKDLSPSTITMSMRDASLAELLAELSKQAETPIEAARHNGMPNGAAQRWPRVVYSVDVKGDPFWLALEKICAATGTSYELRNPQTNQPAVFIQPARPDRQWAGYEAVGKGPALLMVQGVHRGGVVNVGDYGDVERSITLNLLGQIEPKFAPIRGPLTIKITRATDDAGAELKPIADAAVNPEMNPSHIAGGEGGLAQGAVVRLSDPTGTSRAIASLAGSATFRVNSKVAVLKVDNLATMNATPMQFREQLLVLSRPRMNDSQWTVPVTIFRNGGTDADWQSLQRAMQSGGAGAMRLLDAKGRAWQPAGVNNAGGGYYDAANSKVDLQITFRRDRYNGSSDGEHDVAPGPPTRLEWEVPVESTDITVDFDFKDIALP
jgi:hypothetical protein